MTEIRETSIPEAALLSRYAMRPECYTDAYTCSLPLKLTLFDFVETFYSTRLFKAEKLLLRLVFKKDDTEWDPAQLRGWGQHFAAWTVEDRSETELLMSDVTESTRSWFRVEHKGVGTDVYFGSALVPPEGRSKPSIVARALIGPHKAYSRALLRAAAQQFAA